MLNRAILMGRLTANPELRQTSNGISVLSFSIAIDRSFSNQNGERQTDFINCVAWRQTAEFISKYFGKGKMIAVDGSIQTRKYVDSNGNNRTAFEVVAERVSFCGSKGEEGGGGASYAQNAAPSTPQNAPKFEQPATPGESFSVGELGNVDEFEEIGTDDSNLPF